MNPSNHVELIEKMESKTLLVERNLENLLRVEYPSVILGDLEDLKLTFNDQSMFCESNFSFVISATWLKDALEHKSTNDEPCVVQFPDVEPYEIRTYNGNNSRSFYVNNFVIQF